MRIAGFNDRGEARIVDEHGLLVGYGELRLEDAHLTGLDKGDRFALQVVITWTTAERPEPESGGEQPDAALPNPDDIDFDGLDFGELLS